MTSPAKEPLRLAWLVVVLTVLVVAMLLWRPVSRLWSSSAQPLARLACTEPLPAAELERLAGSLPDASWSDALAAYRAGDWASAAQHLRAVAAGESAALVNLALGITLLQSSPSEPAIGALERAVIAGSDAVKQRALWYLGNARLLQGDPKGAAYAFGELRDRDGFEARRAAAAITAIQAATR